jgi:hypothetical protein
MRMFHPAAVEGATEEYRLGSYTLNGQDDYTVFPCIDEQGRVRNLKVQHYDSDPYSARFAHSDKSAYWLGRIWADNGRLPKDAVFPQACLFGEHLLARYPDKHVCLVESEKTALIMAAARPEFLWLATAGCGGLSAERLNCLRGRRVTLFPDSGCYQKWSHQMQLTTGILYNLSPRLECYRPNTDLADLMLGEAQPP